MSDNIIKQVDVHSQLLDDDDDRYEKKSEKKLTLQQKESFGLGVKKVILSNNNEYELWRDEQAAYVKVIASGAEFTLNFENTARTTADYYARFKVKIKDIKLVESGKFYDSLAATGLWKSINVHKTTGVYLSRLSIAMRGISIKYVAGADAESKLEVDHKDQCCANDHYSNLEVLTKSDHLKKEQVSDSVAITRRKEARELTWSADEVRACVEDLIWGVLDSEEERLTPEPIGVPLIVLLNWLDEHKLLLAHEKEILDKLNSFRL